jgi:hypothetical protein
MPVSDVKFEPIRTVPFKEQSAEIFTYNPFSQGEIVGKIKSMKNLFVII